jgi:membrane associated rhomboid family serine protease
LQGVFLVRFIHADMEHLYNFSSLTYFISCIAIFLPRSNREGILFGILFSGLITWIIGRSNYHIGASGLIYVLFSFVFFKGIQTKYNRLVALSLAVIVIYGGMVWYVSKSRDYWREVNFMGRTSRRIDNWILLS